MGHVLNQKKTSLQS